MEEKEVKIEILSWEEYYKGYTKKQVISELAGDHFIMKELQQELNTYKQKLDEIKECVLYLRNNFQKDEMEDDEYEKGYWYGVNETLDDIDHITERESDK